MGSIVGHEMTHGFASCGSNYEFKGEKKEMLTNEIRQLYIEKIQCFIIQYNKIEVEPSIFVTVLRTSRFCFK